MKEILTLTVAEVMDRLIVPATNLERSVLINIPQNVLDPTTVGRYCNSDEELSKAIITGAYFNDGTCSDFKAKELAPDCYFVDFRMIPVNDIAGGYKKDIVPKCPFRVPKGLMVADGEQSGLAN